MIEHRYAQAGDIRLHYATAGSGRLILFLHGHPDCCYLWKDQLAHFGQSFQAVAPDLRGYNLSDKPAGVANYKIPLVVEDIRRLVEQLGAQQIVLVGHDWGAVVAWEF